MVAVYFGRQLFMDTDYINHQASYGFVLNKDTFVRIDKGNPGVPSDTSANNVMPFVGHSFNQFILPVEGGFVFADHGDAGTTRAFTFGKFQPGAITRIGLPAFSFKGNSGKNVTFAQMGGLAKKSNGFIFTGTYENTNADTDTQHSGSRNLFIVTIDDDLTTVSAPVYITNYNDKDTHNAASPKIVRLGNTDRYLLMWEQITSLYTHAVVIDGNGNLLGQIKELPIPFLSQNDVLRYNPANGKVYWAIVDPDNDKRLAIYSYAVE
jgi:hypothetical protein